MNKNACRGDAEDAHAHSPGLETMTCVKINDAHVEWCKKKHEKPADRRKAPPTLRALQGSPESERQWRAHFNEMIMSKPLKFWNTTHNKTVHRTECKGETMHT